MIEQNALNVSALNVKPTRTASEMKSTSVCSRKLKPLRSSVKLRIAAT